MKYPSRYCVIASEAGHFRLEEIPRLRMNRTAEVRMQSGWLLLSHQRIHWGSDEIPLDRQADMDDRMMTIVEQCEG